MDNTVMLAAAVGGTFLITALITFLIVNGKAKKNLDEYKSINDAIKDSKEKLTNAENKVSVANEKLNAIKNKLTQAKEEFNKIDSETKKLQQLKAKAVQIQKVISGFVANKQKIVNLEKKLHDVMAKIDLYSRIDEFVEQGFFETPDYLYETSARFAEEIKLIRNKQKDLIKKKTAITCPDTITVTGDKTRDRQILNGQIKFMLTVFNIQCDLLIGKVNPGNFPRTLERIEKLAGILEKSAATLHCGFNLDYVKLKYEECKLQYQFKLKKQEEQDEQRLVREQMREEQKAIREYERVIRQAEEEEQLYKDMLEKAQKQLELATDEEKAAAEQRIKELENLLALAEAKEERAKSMAEQTRRGHVYIISNVGSFGDKVYKIGLTRRLDPMLRVKELGDASVPFAFDVHAMIYVEDAPALETALHREFSKKRVNAVNFRKEFFNTDLESIRKAVEKLTNGKAEFKMTAVAEEYFESRRLQGGGTSI